MLEYITSERMANAICQDTSYKGKYLLVEGQHDYILFKKFFNSEETQIQNTHGKQNIIDVYDLVIKRGFDNVLGIVDSDFNNLNGVKNTRDLIFYTDTHDLETMLFASKALDSLIDIHCKEDKVAAFLNQEKTKDLRQILFDRSSYLGYLKWANNINNWGLLFKPQEVDKPDLKIDDFISKETLKFTDIETMVRTVFNYSRGKVKLTTDEKTVVTVVKKLSEKNVDHYQLCNGHDVANIFSLSLRKKTSNLNANSVTANQVEKELILAYEARHFASTYLYSQLKNYEADKICNILNC